MEHQSQRTGSGRGHKTGKLFFLLYVRLGLCDTMSQSGFHAEVFV